ncbi:MAG: saccharopine dehydrogenase C-terminal domain-containing protein [Candidatus Liptonbacteria bacterium]|nr:saccharopine dehydrogenase C-terminal domain-containing protein [Candidatus Liptonbacteria bacterium]
MEKYKFDGKILIIGLGSVGQGVLPLLSRHLDVSPERITVVTADTRGENVAREYGVRFIINPLTQENYEKIVLSHINRGDFLLNVSVNVSSAELIELCQRNGILYLDTCIEPWPGGYTDPSRSISERSNYALREEARAIRMLTDINGPRPTAVLAHGANPGIISHILKEAILNVAADTGHKTTMPASQEEWARLAQALEIKVIHIAERDTQMSQTPKRMGEFINTWSIDGFFSEGSQPSEMGWGVHEKELPNGGKRHEFGCGSAIYLEQPGFLTKVRSWTPTAEAQHGWIITHNESISIADFLTAKDGDKVIYRPTVHYAYHPCDGAVLSLHELAGKNGELQKNQRLISEEILPGGVDELGVLLMGHKKNAYWYGSRLSIDEARRLIPHNNATGLQVTAGILGAMVWAIQNPTAGIVDSDELDHRVVMDVARPYLGEIFGAYTDWTPLLGRGKLFPEQLDKEDQWQFKNFRVS